MLDKNLKGAMLVKQNTKFVWIYVAILFSFALILILFAGLTQNNFQKELNDRQMETAGIKKSVTALTAENEKLSKEKEALAKEKEELLKENEKNVRIIEAAFAAVEGEGEITKILTDAYAIKQTASVEAAQEMIKDINVYQLTKSQKIIYDMIIGE